MTARRDSDAAKREELRDWCQVKRCRKDSDLIYKGVGLCDEHWTAACQDGSGTETYLAENLVEAAILAVDWEA